MASTARTLWLARLALLATATWAQAGSILASGPLKIAMDDNYSCTAVNVGTSDLAQVEVDVTVAGLVGNRKNVRATFCNTSTGDCLQVQ